MCRNKEELLGWKLVTILMTDQQSPTTLSSSLKRTGNNV